VHSSYTNGFQVIVMLSGPVTLEQKMLLSGPFCSTSYFISFSIDIPVFDIAIPEVMGDSL
jgi:hypothetical protein